MASKLILIGAGPGDPELITLKGIKAIGHADVILYDALTSSELLKFAKASCKKLYVGKRQGNHSHTQTEINKLIIHYARQDKNVVRLKGGDPFIFGRGMEEVLYAERYGIPVEVIPGLSSSTSLTALNKIPLTHRGISKGFWVLTATTRKGALNPDLKLACQTDSTIVILMGLNKLKEISTLYCEFGKGNIPALVIANGSTDKEQRVVSHVSRIAEETAHLKIKPPATLIIGKVIDLRFPFYQIDEIEKVYNYATG